MSASSRASSLSLSARLSSSSLITRTPSRSLSISRPTTASSTASTNPYGKSHRQRAPALPRPTVAQFPQLVVMTDGSTYTQYTTSPRSTIRLTRDVHNNPLYRPGEGGLGEGDDEGGRMGRFKRKFEGSDGEEVDFSALSDVFEPVKEAKSGGDKKSQ